MFLLIMTLSACFTLKTLNTRDKTLPLGLPKALCLLSSLLLLSLPLFSSPLLLSYLTSWLLFPLLSKAEERIQGEVSVFFPAFSPPLSHFCPFIHHSHPCRLRQTNAVFHFIKSIHAARHLSNVSHRQLKQSCLHYNVTNVFPYSKSVSWGGSWSRLRRRCLTWRHSWQQMYVLFVLWFSVHWLTKTYYVFLCRNLNSWRNSCCTNIPIKMWKNTLFANISNHFHQCTF